MNKYREFSTNFPQPEAPGPRCNRVDEPIRSSSRHRGGKRERRLSTDTTGYKVKTRMDTRCVCVCMCVRIIAHASSMHPPLPLRAFRIISQTGCNVNNLYWPSVAEQPTITTTTTTTTNAAAYPNVPRTRVYISVSF